eukprot:scaffold70126_cov67-Phaeocystis_antarctica.AAC.6
MTRSPRCLRYQNEKSSAARGVASPLPEGGGAPQGHLRRAQGPRLDIDRAFDVGAAQVRGLQRACRRRRHPAGPQPRDQGVARRPHGRLVGLGVG